MTNTAEDRQRQKHADYCSKSGLKDAYETALRNLARYYDSDKNSFEVSDKEKTVLEKAGVYKAEKLIIKRMFSGKYPNLKSASELDTADADKFREAVKSYMDDHSQLAYHAVENARPSIEGNSYNPGKTMSDSNFRTAMAKYFKDNPVYTGKAGTKDKDEADADKNWQERTGYGVAAAATAILPSLIPEGKTVFDKVVRTSVIVLGFAASAYFISKAMNPQQDNWVDRAIKRGGMDTQTASFTQSVRN